MEETLVKRSDFIKIKYKFFIIRIVTYFSFLCIPIWIQYTLDMNLLVQAFVLILYMLFMSGQWYLLGKEIDHRLKIYYRANSSMERIIYRVIIGSIVMMLLFGIISLFPSAALGFSFWMFFILLGIFYSWPTRGKIIEETMSGQFGEMRYLDSFEKTILILSFVTFIISLPELPLFENTDALKLYFDPSGKVSGVLWGFLETLYYPFFKYPRLYNLIWSFHFYFIGIGIFLLTFYCMLRYFFSRRLSMLGVFAVLSTWSFSRTLTDDFFTTQTTTVSIIWLWSIMWSSRSGTYRSGLLTGLVGCYLTTINAANFVFLPISLYASYNFFMNDKTTWFKRQWIKYNGLGIIISLGIIVFSPMDIHVSSSNFSLMMENIVDLIYRKAFFVISPIGLCLMAFYLTKSSRVFFTYVNFDELKVRELFVGVISLTFFGLIFNPEILLGFTFMWILAFFALIPIEWIFQSISRLRSKRNLIYAMYILVCLLDSHLENRFRIVGKMFLELESLIHFIQL